MELLLWSYDRCHHKQHFSVLCDKVSDSTNTEQLSFCARYTDENEDMCKDFLKYVHCQSGLTGKDLCNE